MDLIDVISAVTEAPARVLKKKGWCHLEGILNRATLFRVNNQSNMDRIYMDTRGQKITPEKFIEPVAIITREGFTSLEV